MIFSDNIISGTITATIILLCAALYSTAANAGEYPTMDEVVQQHAAEVNQRMQQRTLDRIATQQRKIAIKHDFDARVLKGELGHYGKYGRYHLDHFNEDDYYYEK